MIILASGSERRQELLKQMGISFSVLIYEHTENIQGSLQSDLGNHAPGKLIKDNNNVLEVSGKQNPRQHSNYLSPSQPNPFSPREITTIVASEKMVSAIGFIEKISDFYPAGKEVLLSEAGNNPHPPIPLSAQLARCQSLYKQDKIVLTADTLVSLKGQILNKPANTAEAVAMLETLSNNTHTVTTAICLLGKPRHAPNNIFITASQSTQVTFYQLSQADILAYTSTQEPYDKAGAYAIQGMGGVFVKEIVGSYANVVGLPIGKLARILDLSFLYGKSTYFL